MSPRSDADDSSAGMLQHLFCMVPASHKVESVQHTLRDAISAQYPSAILRSHSGATLLIDTASTARFLQERAIG